MKEFRSMGEKIFGVVFVLGWLVSRPFVGTYFLLRWFVLAVAKETGNRVVKMCGAFIAFAIVAYVAESFLH
jgi:hypothetical protein